MLTFDKDDLFPLQRGFEEWSYVDAQAHSALVDSHLGMHVEKIEAELNRSSRAHYGTAGSEQHWIGLPAKTLLTPYTEIRFLLELLQPQPGETIVDLGAGYGRMGFVIAKHFPGVSFLGYEVVAERVAEGSRALCDWVGEHASASICLTEADLSLPSFKPATANYYFLYDFGSRDAIAKTLNDLRLISMSQKICVIGRGRASRDAIERGEPWLSQVNAPEHFKHFSIYRS